MTQTSYVPEPKPVFGPIEISALYYPGTEQRAEWDMVEQTLPHIRPLLGWYDEGNPEVVDWQIKWAVEHGISSFCVDWYWNRGVQRLDHWVKAYYRARYRHYLKWYIMWANHNEPGAHSTQDQINVTRFWLDNYLHTPEYYTMDGYPVIVVWSLDNLDRDFIAEAAQNGETLQPGEGVRRALDISNRLAQQDGLPGIRFVDMYHSWQYEQPKIDIARDNGYCAQMIYNFDTISYHLAPETRTLQDTPTNFSYDLVMTASRKWWERTSRDPKFPFWPIIPTGWNDIPRSFENARIIHSRTVDKFRAVCQDCRDFCERHGFSRVVIAPLNEWQEGSYIEPNQEFGFGMYDALRDVFCDRPADGWPKNILPQDLGLGPYDYPPTVLRKTSHWDFATDTQGWYRNPYGTAYIKNVDGAIRFFRTQSKHAAIRTRIAPLDTAAFSRFTVTMRITPNPTMPPNGDELVRLLWGTPEKPIFSPDFVVSFDASVTTPAIQDGEWHTYTLDLAGHPFWNGHVNELWFDSTQLRNAWTDIRSMSFE